MAKYRRYRKYSRRNRGKWSANIQEIGTTTLTLDFTQPNTWYRDFTLAFNPTQVNTAVSQTYTVKNFEVTFQLDTKNGNTGLNFVEDCVAYIMFVPQGMTITPNYNLQHPEYIMAYKFLGSPESDSSSSQQPFRVRTRLSRKLNTGDSVILFLKGNIPEAVQGTPSNIEFHGLVRWWTKAN